MGTGGGSQFRLTDANQTQPCCPSRQSQAAVERMLARWSSGREIEFEDKQISEIVRGPKFRTFPSKVTWGSEHRPHQKRSRTQGTREHPNTQPCQMPTQ
jgi:hypothetical protein